MDLKDIFKDDLEGKKACYGVVGNNIDYTLSPVIQNAAIQSYGINAVYRRIEVPDSAESWKKFLLQSHSLPLAGFNITIPHKEKIIGSTGYEADFFSSLILAANTVSHQQGKRKYYNTDGFGFCEDIRSLGISLKGKTVVVLGAGGVSKAILGSIYTEGLSPEKIILLNRTPEKADSLKTYFETIQKEGHAAACKSVGTESPKKFIIEVARNDMEKEKAIRGAFLIVNTTPLDGRGHMFDFLWLSRNVTVYDTIYKRKTELMAAAERIGAKAFGGLGMLIRQGAKSFEIWFNQKAPISVMRKAAEEEMKERTKS